MADNTTHESNPARMNLQERIQKRIKDVSPEWVIGVRAKPDEWRELLDAIFVDAKGEPARFVPDDQGGHIEFAGKIWRPE